MDHSLNRKLLQLAETYGCSEELLSGDVPTCIPIRELVSLYGPKVPDVSPREPPRETWWFNWSYKSRDN